MKKKYKKDEMIGKKRTLKKRKKYNIENKKYEQPEKMKTNVYKNGQNEQLKDTHKIEKMKKNGT